MTFEKQRITVLGSTGSIGVSTLEVIARHPERFEVFALSAATRVDLMLVQCAQFKPQYAVMVSAPHARLLAEKINAHNLPVQVLSAAAALEMIASDERVEFSARRVGRQISGEFEQIRHVGFFFANLLKIRKSVLSGDFFAHVFEAQTVLIKNLRRNRIFLSDKT